MDDVYTTGLDSDGVIASGRGTVVVTGEPTNTGSPRGNSIGSLCHEVTLAPGVRVRLTYVLGVTD